MRTNQSARSLRISRGLRLEDLEIRRLFALNPTAVEQELLQLVNRFRSDPAGEYGRLISSVTPLQSFDTEVTQQINISQVDANLFRSEMQALTAAPPLVWNEVLQNVATTQNGRMITNQRQEHLNGIFSHLVGLGLSPESSVAQNAFWNNVGVGKTPYVVHAAYVIDWAGNFPVVPGGMQAGRGHRVNMINANYNSIGSAVTPGSALTNTQILTRLNGNQAMATGAIFEDKNKSGWYEAGEGIGGAQIVFQGPAGTFSTTSLSAGGYQIVLPAGTYTATASGGGMAQQVVVPNIVVGANNVWKNLIYDPTVVALDSREPNDSVGAATALANTDQTLEPLTIHAGDVDYFRFTSASTGNATFSLNFTNASGNLDLRLMDASGNVLATSATNADTESITFGLTRGADYYVSVFSSVNATNGRYVLQLNLPEPIAPTAVADRAIMDLATPSIVIPVTANDSDPDGSTASLRPTLVSSNNGSFVVDASSVVFTPNDQFTGFASANYTVTDDQGLQSSSANINVFVVDLSRAHPWLNPRKANDVNDDEIVSALDALLVITDLVTRGPRELPKNLGAIGNTRGFIDVSGSDSVEPRDVLLIIDELNRTRPGSGEGEPSPLPTDSTGHVADIAIMQLQLPDEAQERKRRR